jgi:hypothetical protein
MPAILLIQFKEEFPDGSIVEVRVWRLPRASVERPHGLKYSLFYGRPGERIVAYDNESGKGDHRHYRARELPYTFVTLSQLIADFEADIAAERMRDE